MAFFTELDVINDMLSLLGEAPLNAIIEDHPLVSAGVRMLRVASFREQAKSWWFNQEVTTLVPDTSGAIFIPSDIIKLDPTNGDNYVQRAGKLYRPYGNTSDRAVFTDSVELRVVRHLPFEDLPPSAANLVGVAAVMDFQKAYDADTVKIRLLQADYASAWSTIRAEHIRAVGANLLYSPSMMAKLNRIGRPPSNWTGNF